MGKITLVVDSMSMIDKLDFKAIQKETGYAREDIDFITQEEYKELQRKELADLKEYANENGERIVEEAVTEEFLKRYHEYLEYDSGFHKSHSSKSFRHVKHKSRNQKTRQKKANKKAKRNNH